MSWLKKAVQKAVVASPKNNLSRIRTVADSVVQHAGQAVVGGAKLFQDRIGNRNVQCFRQTVKRLEELSVSSRGEERVLLLRRWLVSLKEVEKINRVSGDDIGEDVKHDEARQPTLVLYHDLDHGGEPLNFRGVFLHSEALEGIVLSMTSGPSIHTFVCSEFYPQSLTKSSHKLAVTAIILLRKKLPRQSCIDVIRNLTQSSWLTVLSDQILEGPNDEEIALLLEIFGLCLMGGKEVHNGIMSKIQDLAKLFTCYEDEVLMKRDELLQYVQSSITGLKISADLVRIDVEVSSFKSKLKLRDSQLPLSEANRSTSEEMDLATAEAVKEALGQVRVYSKLKALLLEKKAIHGGDSPEVHTQKVDKLRILLESLASSTTKAENRILDHRSHKEAALSYRRAKTNEVSQVEKELVTEIGELERKKEELEAELKKINHSLATANGRLRNAREERNQFDAASNEILQHLQTKEDELSRSVTSCRTEADVVRAWISYMQDAWDLQSTFAKQKEEQVNDELGRYAEYFANLVVRLLPAYKIELGNYMTHFKELGEKLKSSDGLDKVTDLFDENSDENFTPIRKRKNLEEEYLDLEAKLITTFSVVESIKQLYTQSEDFSRKHDQRVDLLLDSVQEIKDQFDSIDRPTLKVAWGGGGAFHKSPKGTRVKLKPKKEESSYKGQVVDCQYFLDSDEELETLESEYVKIFRDHAAQEINDWEL